MILWFSLSLFGATVSSAYADDSPARNNFGSVGLIDMPSARMAPDGEISVGASFFQDTQHYNFGFQILPWLETSFRYSGLAHFEPGYPVYWDRSFAAKVRLWDETEIFPATAIGIDDLVGTGVYSGEYLVTSKRIGPLDISLGMGWGRLGSTALFENPLTTIFSSFRSRPTTQTSTGSTPLTGAGGANFNVFFRGPNSGLFGGVIWHTPIERLSVIAEYSSDRYTLEAQQGGFRPRNQINFGASYQVADNMTIGLDWLYGRSIGGNILFQLDPKTPQYDAKVGPLPPPIATRSPEEQQQALQILLSHSRGENGRSNRASLNRAAFVDALWRPGIQNAELQGKSLVLATTGDPGHNCIAAAQISQRFDSNITSIIVRGGLASVECVTTAADEPAYQALSFVEYGLETSAVAQTPASPQIINAAGFDVKAATQSIRSHARRQEIGIEAIALSESVAVVYYSNARYSAEADALDRLTRILMKDTPPGVEKFRFIAVVNGVPQQEFDVLRGPEERKAEQNGDLGLFQGTTTIGPPPMQNSILADAAHRSYPRFTWSAYPQLRQELFDPDNPFAVQLAAAAEGSVELRPGFSFNGEIETSLFDDFNLERQSNSSLPHVRSDFLKYFAQGKTGIGQLDVEYRFRLAPALFATAKAGYLESMFAGGGGELLWRPQGQRWALGADAYEVWQRGFDRLFDLQDYHAFTGHVSVYYASPWYDLNFKISAGQYLAGDRGITFQMTRRFSTGVEVGAFFTKTNISPEQFGEGSFDKGIIVRIPLGWALPIETQGEWGIDIRPVQRDGGQRLAGDATLFDETRRTSYGEIWNSRYGTITTLDAAR